jgi:hypothetical protein
MPGIFDRNARGSDLLPERDSVDTRRERDGDLFERDARRESSGDHARTLRELQQEVERMKAALRRITDDINAGRGVIGRLINDEEPPPPTEE